MTSHSAGVQRRMLGAAALKGAGVGVLRGKTESVTAQLGAIDAE